MKNYLEFPGKVEVNRSLTFLALVGVVFGNFRLMQVTEYAAWAIGMGTVLTLFVIGSLLYKSWAIVKTDPPRLEKKFSILGFPLLKFSKNISNVVWVRARPDALDLVVEAGTIGYMTTEVVRLKNAYGKRNQEASEISLKISKLLNIEDKGFRDAA